jgi:hypothetical protein
VPHIFAQRIDGRDGVTRGQRDDGLLMGIGNRAGADEQGASRALDEHRKGGLDLGLAGPFGNDELLREGLCGTLHIGALGLGLRPARTDEHGNGRRLGSELAQQF